MVGGWNQRDRAPDFQHELASVDFVDFLGHTEVWPCTCTCEGPTCRLRQQRGWQKTCYISPSLTVSTPSRKYRNGVIAISKIICRGLPKVSCTSLGRRSSSSFPGGRDPRGGIVPPRAKRRCADAQHYRARFHHGIRQTARRT